MKGTKPALAVLCVSLLVVLSTRCALRAQQLRMQPMTFNKTVDPANQTSKKYLLYPLEDLRGDKFSFVYPTSYLPPFFFFHAGGWNQYPEQSALVLGSQGGRAFVTVGSLPESFPHLLATAMREMRFTSNATPIEQVNTRVELSSYDYVVTGKLTRRKLSSHVNPIPLLYPVSIIGAPFQFVHFDGEFEVSVFSSGSLDKPLMTKTYSIKGTKLAGLYYGHSAAFDLFIGGLEKTLPQVVTDIAAVGK